MEYCAQCLVSYIEDIQLQHSHNLRQAYLHFDGLLTVLPHEPQRALAHAPVSSVRRPVRPLEGGVRCVVLGRRADSAVLARDGAAGVLGTLVFE